MSRLLAGTVVAGLLVGGAWVSARAASAPEVTNEPSAAILELRRRFMTPEFAPLTFHNIDAIFNTQTVDKGASVSPLQADLKTLDFTYEYKGETHPAGDILERTFTNALLIMKDGKIVYETYRNFTGPDTRFLSMSMAKSITSMLVGIALQDGAIKSLDQQITDYVPELKGSAYDGVTIRNALHMQTGVNRSDSEQFAAGSPGAARREQILIRNARPAVDEALMVDRKEAPGKTFDYSTLNTTVVGWVLERATKTRITDYTTTKLWQPLGTQASAYWLVDGPTPAARPLNGMGFNATLRDFARLGTMMLNGGTVQGKQVIPRAWAEETTGGKHPPVAPGANTGYQYFWWTEPNAPAYTAQGLQGQYIFNDPATRTTIVKLSYVPLNNREAGGETRAFFLAASKWKPK